MPEQEERTLLKRISENFRVESAGVHPRLFAAHVAASVLPRRSRGTTRARIFSMLGFQVGSGTVFQGVPHLNGPGRLHERITVGSDCFIGIDCVLDLEEHITIGDRVTLSPGAMVLTSTHELASKERRAGPVTRSPVTIENDAWIGARAIVLPGVTVGAGAIVDPGSVVNKDVAPDAHVRGIPAMPVKASSKP